MNDRPSLATRNELVHLRWHLKSVVILIAIIGWELHIFPHKVPPWAKGTNEAQGKTEKTNRNRKCTNDFLDFQISQKYTQKRIQIPPSPKDQAG
jgi:hypothetical protein